MNRQKASAIFQRYLVRACAAITMAVFIFLIGYILIKGIPHIKPDLFAWEYNADNVSLMPAFINTITMTFLSLLIAVPFGIFCAVYLIEYTGRGNKIVEVIRVTAETLAGIPSIIYGIFGYLFFVTTLGLGITLISGALTLSIMILPLIMRTAEEALKAVDDTYREGSFGLGAGRLRTVFKVVLPSAVPGILAGVILAVGRIVGETAALLYTAGDVAKVATSFNSSARTLSMHMYRLASEGFNVDEAYATAVVLLILVVGINALSAFIAKKLNRGLTN